MRLSKASSFTLMAVAVMVLSLILAVACKDSDKAPGAYSFNASMATMGGTYTSDVIDIHYIVNVTTNRPGTVPLAPGFGDVFSLVEYSTDGGVRYQLCHDTEGNPGNYFTFTEAPASKEATFYWDAAGDLGPNAVYDSVMIRVRLFHGGADPCEDAPADIASTHEFSIVLSTEIDCGEPPVITTEALPDATDEVAYSFSFEAIGGYGDLTWSLLEPIDPAMVTGLSLSHFGVLAGTPVVHGEAKGTNFNLSLGVLVVDSCPLGAREDSRNFSLMIYPQDEPPVECDPAPVFALDQTLPNGVENESYSYTLMLEVPGHGDVTFSVISEGSLPTGLTLNASSGVISGTPGMETAGNYDLIFQVTDSCEDPGPQSDTIELSLIIEEGVEECDPGPSITTTSLPEGTEGEPYDFTMEATGGHGALTWSLGEGAELPAGMNFSAAGVFSGTPEETGDFPLLIEVEDECFIVPQTDFVILTLVINEALPACDPPPIIDVENEGVLPDAYQGSPYSYQFTAQDGHGALSWSVVGGDLPTGLTLDSDGLLSGTVDCGAAVDDYMFDVQVEDSCEDPGPQSDVFTFSLYVQPPDCEPLVINQEQTVPDAEVMLFYNYAIELEASGEGTLMWVLDTLGGDELPDGLEFTNGMITGTPAIGTEGDYNLIVHVSDECPCVPQSDTFEFTLTVNPSTNPCFQDPVTVHTFCLECPEFLPLFAAEMLNFWFIHDGEQQGPATVQLQITYDDTLISVDEMMVMPGDIIMNPANFSASVADGIIEIVYDYTMLPLPINTTGVFAYIMIENINEAPTELMDMEVSVEVLNDSMGDPLSYDTIDCEFGVEGVDL